MSAQSQTTEPAQPTDDDPRLAAYLFDLLEIGAKVAQGVGRQAERQAQPAQEAETPNPPIDLAEQFERVSRAMRRTVLLIRHMAQPAAAKPLAQRTQARKRIIRAVEDAIQLKSKDPESLHAEFRERLDGPDLDDEIDNRPVPEIITDIIRDLGLAHMPGTHPWERRTPRTIEALRARAAAPRPQGPYTPAAHGPDLHPPNQPKRRPHPPDEQELVALAKRLSGTKSG